MKISIAINNTLVKLTLRNKAEMEKSVTRMLKLVTLPFQHLIFPALTILTTLNTNKVTVQSKTLNRMSNISLVL